MAGLVQFCRTVVGVILARQCRGWMRRDSARRLTRRHRRASFCPEMTKLPKEPPKMGERGVAEAAARQERLAAALRDNLKKRKDQARQRRASEAGPAEKE
jgi:hypothetical protein